jgi:hypothetical protein
MQNSITSYGNNLYSALFGGSKASQTESATTDSVSKDIKKTATDTTKSAYLLDLSPAAQKYIREQKLKKDYGFQLLPKEMTKLAEIIGEFKGTEMTTENLTKLQNKLKSSGLDIVKISAKDMVRGFNVQSTMMDALSGKKPIVSAQDRLKNQKAKTTTFFNQVVADWKQTKTKDSNFDKLPGNLSELIKVSKSAKTSA